jgi:hypothetical protein
MLIPKNFKGEPSSKNNYIHQQQIFEIIIVEKCQYMMDDIKK